MRMRGACDESAASLEIAATAGALQDLLITDHARLERGALVAQGPSAALRSRALKRVHRRIVSAGEDRGLAAWMKDLRDHVNVVALAGRDLKDAGLIDRKPRGGARLIDVQAWLALRRRVRSAIDNADQEIDLRTRALVTLAGESGLLGSSFTEALSEQRRANVYRLARGVRLRAAARGAMKSEVNEAALAFAMLMLLSD